MPQLFSPNTNTHARLSLAVFAALPVVAILAGSTVTRSSSNTRVGLALDQPVPFSHKHHVHELGIDCRYCHTSVEDAAQAGLPSTETCMSCHSQIWTNSPLLEPVRQSYATNEPIKWTKINKVPEFVYFNHSVHVNKGISCNHCHGAVQQQQMTAKARTFFMAWCLECHRDPAKYMYKDKENPQLSPREQVFNLYLKYQVDPKMQKATPTEQKLSRGDEQKLDPHEFAEGESLLKERGVVKEQMADCSVCHH